MAVRACRPAQVGGGWGIRQCAWAYPVGSSPRACGGKRLQWQPCLCMPLNNGALLLWWPRILYEHPYLWSSAHLPLRLSPQSQQQSSSWICSLNPMSQHAALAHAGGCRSQAKVHRVVAWAICIGLTLSCLPQAS